MVFEEDWEEDWDYEEDWEEDPCVKCINEGDTDECSEECFDDIYFYPEEEEW